MANWKAPPTDPEKKWLNKSLEIQVILLCNWSCTACDQLSQFSNIGFIKKGTMSLDQIQHFIDEMRVTNSYLGRIRLVGGEPSMHPKIEEICKMLHSQLVETGHVGMLDVITNGSKIDRLKAIRDTQPLKIRVSDENDKQKHHTANFVQTPASLGYEGKMCSAPWHCGMSLNNYGYFPCSSGAGIVRLMNDLEKWQRLTIPTGDVYPFTGRQPGTVMRTWPALQSLCNLCYHGLKDEDKIKCGTGMLPGQHALNRPSAEAWENLAPWLSGQQPDWPVYAIDKHN